MTTTYEVTSERLAAVEVVVARLNRRAAKMGLAPIGLEVLGTIDALVTDENGCSTGRMVTMNAVAVVGEAPVLRGWTFLAAIDHLADGNVVRAAQPLDEGTLAGYRTTPPTCDHCHTHRARATTYVLRHEDGRTARVGSTCVARFVEADAAAAMLLVELLGLLREALALAEAAEDEGFGSGSGRWARYDLERYLAVVHACVRSYGWVSRTTARETDRAATADVAWRAIDARRGDDGWLEVTDADRSQAALSVAWLDRLAETEVDDRSDYLHNVIAACASHVIDFRHLGLAASIVASRTREEGEANRRENAGVRNEFLPATEGTRVKGLRATLQDVRAIESYYGVTLLHRFVSEEGYALTWFASGSSTFEVGRTYSLTATVKSHEERRGRCETLLTRVVETPEPKARASKRAA